MFKIEKVFAEYYITQIYEQYQYAKSPIFLCVCFGVESEVLKTFGFTRLPVLNLEFPNLFRPSRTIYRQL
jgi:hypothetical protein